MTAPLEGLLLIDKPAGPTSHDIVAWVRRATRQESPIEQVAAAALGLATIIAFVYSVFTHFKYVYDVS